MDSFAWGVLVLAQLVAWRSLEAAETPGDREVTIARAVQPKAVGSLTKYYESTTKRPDGESPVGEKKKKKTKKKKKARKKTHAPKPSKPGTTEGTGTAGTAGTDKSARRTKAEKISKGPAGRRGAKRKNVTPHRPRNHGAETGHRKRTHDRRKKHRRPVDEPAAAKRPSKQKKVRNHRKDKMKAVHGSGNRTKIDRYSSLSEQISIKKRAKNRVRQKHVPGKSSGAPDSDDESGSDYSVLPSERKENNATAGSEFSIQNSTVEPAEPVKVPQRVESEAKPDKVVAQENKHHLEHLVSQTISGSDDEISSEESELELTITTASTAPAPAPTTTTTTTAMATTTTTTATTTTTTTTTAATTTTTNSTTDLSTEETAEASTAFGHRVKFKAVTFQPYRITMKPRTYKTRRTHATTTQPWSFECYDCEDCYTVDKMTSRCRSRRACVKMIQNVADEKEKFKLMTQRSCIDSTVDGVRYDEYCYKQFLRGTATTCLFCDKQDCNGNDLRAPEEVGLDNYGNRISETDFRSARGDEYETKVGNFAGCSREQSLIFLSVLGIAIKEF